MTTGGYADRRRRNDVSRNAAEHHAEVWTPDELEVLLDWDGSDSELDALSELLGRTREACRERYYQTKRGRTGSTVTRTVTTTRTETYRVERWADADEWDQRWYR